MAEIVEMFEHSGNFKNVAGAHLLGKLLETIFPIVGGRRKISGESFEKNVALARRDRTTQPDLGSIGHRYQDQRIRRCQPKRVERKRHRSDLLLFDLFDYADTVIGINNLLADLEAHLITSEESYKHQASRIVRLIDKKLFARLLFGIVLELSLSLTSTLVKRQASGEQNSRGQQALGQKRIIFHLAFEIFLWHLGRPSR